MLRKDKSVKTHHKNLRVLTTKMWKVKHGLSYQIINNVFEPKSVPYNMRRQNLFRSRNVHSVRHDTNSLTCLGPRISYIVSKVIKNSKLLYVFKTKIKHWVTVNCSCRLWRPCLQYVFYIWKFQIFHPEISVRNGILMRFDFKNHFVLIFSRSFRFCRPLLLLKQWGLILIQKYSATNRIIGN